MFLETVANRLILLKVVNFRLLLEVIQYYLYLFIYEFIKKFLISPQISLRFISPQKRKRLERQIEKKKSKGKGLRGNKDWEPEQDAKLLLEGYWVKISNCTAPCGEY